MAGEHPAAPCSCTASLAARVAAVEAKYLAIQVAMMVCGSCRSFSSPACRHSSRAALTSVTICVSSRRTSWWSLSGFVRPPRSAVKAAPASMQAWMMPTQPQATLYLPMSSTPLTTVARAKPSGPSRASGPSRQSWKSISASMLPLVPSMPLTGRVTTPGWARSTRKAETPRPVRANTSSRSAIWPPVIQRLLPRSTKPPSCRVAVAEMLAASLPASGSVRQKAPTASPRASSGSQRSRCSRLPHCETA